LSVALCGLVLCASGCAPYMALVAAFALCSAEPSPRRASSDSRPTGTPHRPHRTPVTVPTRKVTIAGRSKKPPIRQASPPRLHLQRGIRAFELFQYRQAIELLGQVLADPTASSAIQAKALLYRGAAAFMLGDESAATRDFQKAARLGVRREEAAILRPDIRRLLERQMAMGGGR